MDKDISRNLQTAIGKEVDFLALLVQASATTATRYVSLKDAVALLGADRVYYN